MGNEYEDTTYMFLSSEEKESLSVFFGLAPLRFLVEMLQKSTLIKMPLQTPLRFMELVNLQEKNGVNITLKSLVSM